MKYIIFTFEGYGFPIAKHLLDEGQDVTVAIVEDEWDTLTKPEKRKYEPEEPFYTKRRLSLYKNIIPTVPATKMIQHMKKIKNPKDYFVFFDFNHLFKFAEQVVDLGFNGNFPTEKDRLFEVDRDEAKDFVKKYYPHLQFANKKEFRTVHAAKKFLKDTEEVWVLKGKIYEAQTFIPTTNDPELAKHQVIETLEAFNEDYEEAGFILETKIPSVVEITPEKIYYDGVPLGMTINFENKPLGSGNLSMQTGCAADLVFPISMENKIHDIAFPPIVDKLAKKHKGLFIWDASLLINRQTGAMYFGEFCPNRPGYNSFFTELAAMPSVSHFFESIVQKRNPYLLGTVASSVTLFNLMRDPNERHILSGATIDFPESIAKDVWPYDIYKKNKKDKTRIVGSDWHLAPITGSGETIDEAVRNLYKNVEKVAFAGVYYRPKSDYLSMDYPTSVLQRLRYGLQKKLYSLPFEVVF
ncbi:MAG TPA: hypothetical protein VF820_03770 [Patescibacteria group bacterium]